MVKEDSYDTLRGGVELSTVIRDLTSLSHSERNLFPLPSTGIPPSPRDKNVVFSQKEGKHKGRKDRSWRRQSRDPFTSFHLLFVGRLSVRDGNQGLRKVRFQRQRYKQINPKKIYFFSPNCLKDISMSLIYKSQTPGIPETQLVS